MLQCKALILKDKECYKKAHNRTLTPKNNTTIETLIIHLSALSQGRVCT